MDAQILTVNLGSASAKLATVAVTRGGLGVADTHELKFDAAHETPASVAERLRPTMQAMLGAAPAGARRAIAHRVVHGGPLAPHAAFFSPEQRQRIAAAAPHAPLHNPFALAVLDDAATWAGDVPQVPVFDTGFFAALPEVARGYALPPAITASQGLQRCGFHGLAHAALARFAARRCGMGPLRLISLQLGSGASVAAIRDGLPRDVSMGFSTLEGLVMATRPGDVDPGVLLHLLDNGYTPAQLRTLLSRQSGLLGLSGHSGRLDELLAADDPASAFAVEMYVYRARKYVGSYLAVLGGVDAIVFGGGAGEHSPQIRARILDGFAFAGIALDDPANAAATGGTHEIGAAGSPRIFAVAVDEARELAMAAHQLMFDG